MIWHEKHIKAVNRVKPQYIMIVTAHYFETRVVLTKCFSFFCSGHHHQPSAGSVQRTNPGNEGRRRLLGKRERRRRGAETRSASGAVTPPGAAAAGQIGCSSGSNTVYMHLLYVIIMKFRQY